MWNRRRSHLCLGKECCLSIFFRGLERQGWSGSDREMERKSSQELSGGGLSSGGVEEFASNFFYDGSHLMRRESVEEAQWHT